MKQSLMSYRDLVAERSLLSRITDTHEWVDVPPEWFGGDPERAYYEALKRQHYDHRSIEPALLFEKFENLQVLLADCATAADYRIQVSHLRTAYQIREYARGIAKIEAILAASPSENAIEALSATSALAASLYTLGDEDVEYSHAQSVTEWMESVAAGMTHESALRGMRSGLPDIDNAISGWEKGKVYLLGGLEKLGKSRLLRYVTSQFLNDDHGGIMFMLEEDPYAIHECIIANRAGVNTDDMGTNHLTSKAFRRMASAAMDYAAQPLYISTKSAMTPEYVGEMIKRKRVEFAKAGHTLDWVAIDYIQRMTAHGHRSENEMYAHIASTLADVARDEHVCMIEISQVNSDVERGKSKSAVHAFLRYGKVFKEAASCIIVLDDPERRGSGEDSTSTYGGEPCRIMTADILQRRGISNVKVKLRGMLQYSKYECIDEQHVAQDEEW